MSLWIDLGGFYRGIRAMKRGHGKVNYAIRWMRPKRTPHFWAHIWTPRWHEGRGPYITIGLGLVAIYRGY